MKLKGFLKRVFNYRKRLTQKGFTLLELLIVVAILATIAGTASMAFNDIDKRASAAAHVAMMDELNKGIRTYRAVQKAFPSRFDSLMQMTADDYTGATSATPFELLDFVESGTPDGADVITLDSDDQKILIDNGITELMYINGTFGNAENEDYVDGTEDCAAANIEDLIESKDNMVVMGNIFLPPAGHGCGDAVELEEDNTTGIQALAWPASDYLRLTGQEDSPVDADDDLLMVGVGPSLSLFDTKIAGAMTTVPVYRHVSGPVYNRFIAIILLDKGEEKLYTIGVVDSALDTKEEELGEWDGQRAT
eukprot:Anaeramoba_flamelloidesa1053652_1953.p1 GENE.a1053652_1953~~a1053652_1953.p1  ORF type:complete len:307 (-),score=41.98 a1053652_1953:257-1177(-)